MEGKSAHTLDDFSLGKEHLVTNDRRLDGWCGEEKNLLPVLGTKSDSSTIQPTASCYTD
jgi:hypothetical protein